MGTPSWSAQLWHEIEPTFAAFPSHPFVTGPTLSTAEETDARTHFVTTARYEWMFFDAAYRRETWPV